MKKVLVLMMILAQSAVVSAQPGEAEGPTGHTLPPIADEGGVLKGQRQMPPDTTRPRIIVREPGINPQQNNKIYRVFFIVRSDEDIVGLADPASYKVARCLNAECTTPDTTTTYVILGTISAETIAEFPFGRGITAEITLNSIEEVRATWGFALLRASDSVLQDAAGNHPVNTNGEPIAANNILGLASEDAIARRDVTPPRISLAVRQVRRIDSDTYELVFLVNRPARKGIPTLYLEDSYRLIRVSNTTRTDITDDADTSFEIEQEQLNLSAPRAPRPAVLTYEVTVTDSDLGSIKGFMVARAEADDLLDRFSNLPVRAEDGALIGIETEGLLRSTPVSLIQPRIRTKVFLGGPLR